MIDVRIQADRDTCIGAGMCVHTAEAVFDHGDDGILEVLREDVPADEEKRVRDAVALCPSGALTVTAE